ncbi:MAG: GGDEF domain-containing protein [Magnetococcales bacterium]|nr:GGDEF domain-containing protein [Magnetococcales bacterium]
MVNTQHTLNGIRDKLNGETPNIAGAMDLLKEVLRRGVCYEETRVFHEGTLILLERVLLPLLNGDRELEAIIHRYAMGIRKSGTVDSDDLAKFLTEIDEGLQIVQDNMMFPEGKPDIDLNLLDRALLSIGYGGVPKNMEGGISTSWHKIHKYLAEVVVAQLRKQNAEIQENSRRNRYLLDFTKGLASTSSRLERSCDVINQLSESLENLDDELPLESISQVISAEIQGVGEQTAQVIDNLETIDYTTKELKKLFHQADKLLMETQDSDLMDAVSGMPNRYGLMARINQARIDIHEGATSGFAVLFVGIVDLGRIRKNWGRERFSALMRWLGGRIQDSGSYEIFRTASDGLAIFAPDSDKNLAITMAKTIKDNVLDPIIKQESIPQEFHFGLGGVVATPEMDEEAILLAGSECMRRSILNDGNPIF